MKNTHFVVSCDTAIMQGDNTAVNIFKIVNDIPYLTYYEKDGIGVYLGDCDEMMTGVLLQDKTIMAEGSNFIQLKNNLKAIESELIREDLRNGL